MTSFISKGIVANIIEVGEQLTELQKIKLDDEKVEKNISTIKKLSKQQLPDLLSNH